jgi:hypothetical protein
VLTTEMGRKHGPVMGSGRGFASWAGILDALP